MSKPLYYLLDGYHPVAAASGPAVFAWILAHQDQCTVGDTYLEAVSVRIHTRFTGIDGQTHDEGDPFLFETRLFGGALNGVREEYASWDEAAQGHDRWVAQALSALSEHGAL